MPLGGGSVRVGAAFVFMGSVLALTTACGKIRHPAGKAPTLPRAGAGGSGGMSAAGSGVVGGAGMMSTADSGEGGLPPEGSGGNGGVAAAGKAGASTGGATSGAPATAGAAQAGGASIAVPAGCEPGAQHVGGAYCSTELSCDGTNRTVSCAVDATGLWTCSCTEGSSSTSFDFQETTGTRTCELAAEACVHPQTPTGTESCETTHEIEGYLCTAHTVCRQQDPGSPIATRTDTIATCQASSDLAVCRCSAPEPPDYYITHIDIAEGCDYLGYLCKDEPTPLDDWSCGSPTLYPGSMGYGCSGNSNCTRHIVLSDKTELTQAEYYYSRCRLDGDQTRCACSNAASIEQPTILVDLPEADVDTCQTALDACSGLEPIELEGSPDCVPTTQTIDPNTCTHALECTQAGKSGDLDVTVLTRASATCRHRSDDMWVCSCNGYITDEFMLDARSVSTVCDDALEQCPHLPRGLE